jgi:hypothetical protein
MTDWYKIKRILVGTQQVYPATWNPWANTLAYYPLNSTTTVNDLSWNSRNLTNNWVTFGTYWWVDCAYFSNSNSKKLYWNLPLSWTQNFTFNIWINRQWDSYTWLSGSQIINLWDPWTNSAQFWIAIRDNGSSTNKNKYIAWSWWTDIFSSTTNTTNTWNMVTVTHQAWTVKMYVNATLLINDTISFNVANTNFTVWSFQSPINDYLLDYQSFYWYMSWLICESSIWNLDYITKYYNATKSNYWL